MKALLENGNIVGCKVLSRKPKTWFRDEMVLVEYKSTVVDKHGADLYSNNRAEWVKASNVFE